MARPPGRVARWRRVLPREAVGRVARYSRFVALMRLALPVLAVALALVIFIWPTFQKEVSQLPVVEMSKREMLHPRYSGTTTKGDPFTVLAARAEQPGNSFDVVDLFDIQAEMKSSGGGWSRLTARTGHYDRAKNTIDLAGEVHIENHQGYDVLTDEAHVRLKEGRAFGEKPVAGKGPMGKISAAGFRIEDGGKTIVFTGRPKLNMEGGGP